MDLSTGERETEAGLERYRFRVNAKGVMAAAKRAAGSAEVMNQILAGWYTLSPRPDPRDILSSKVTPLDGETVEVELVIKRGHYFLLSLLHEHEDLMIRADGRVTCSCHPGEEQWIARHTLPDYGKEFT